MALNRSLTEEKQPGVEGIFFDLIGTLVVLNDPVTELKEWFDKARNCLCGYGRDMHRDTFDDKFLGHFAMKNPPEPAAGLTIFERRIRDFCTGAGLEFSFDDVRYTVRELIEVWDSYITPDSESHDVLERLKRDYTLCPVSNFDHPPYIRSLLDESGLERYFDHAIISGEVGINKPEAGIFQIALEKAGLTPGEVIHVGDSDDDTRGVLAAGISPILIQRESPETSERVSTVPEVTLTAGITRISNLSELIDLLH